MGRRPESAQPADRGAPARRRPSMKAQTLSQLGPAFKDSHPPLTDEQAVLEADACLQCGGPCTPAPCVGTCPAGIDIPGFIRDIAERRPVDAATKIFADNI